MSVENLTDNDLSSQIAFLREATNISVYGCKRLLESVNGDLGKALDAAKNHPDYRERSQAYKKPSRIFSYTHKGRIGVMVKLSADTDFALNSAEGTKLGLDTCLQATAYTTTDPQSLLNYDYVREPSKRLQDVYNETNEQMKENIELIEIVRMEAI